MIIDFKEETRALVAELSVLSLQPQCRDEEIYVTRQVLERIYRSCGMKTPTNSNRELACHTTSERSERV